MLLNKKASIRRGREKGAKVNQTFFDLIVHWERVIRLHVGRNQDLSRVLQHLKIENERNLNTQLFLIYPMCCGVIFISYYIFTAEIRDAMNLCNKTSQMNLSKRENQVLKKELVWITKLNWGRVTKIHIFTLTCSAICPSRLF